ncbi:TadE family protein [Sphingomonas sp. S2-65]|uniref:TadE family protein n=1 Tax=Sphingomonas sp. S2-65 TaxID=2903960 RepID=UPI001F24C06D|nr:TadE family protein [Sphingomonas sp. S2-65]UYY58923.1 pilus assembly protein [Sphingomonas sp. S2-65]
MTAVEFAMLAPVMLMLICGSLEVGHMIFARVALEGAVTEAARVATASLEASESNRFNSLRESISRTMAIFPTEPGRTIQIETRVFHDFSTAYPEPYTDANRNKAYDIGEAYEDRNRNGHWDPAIPITGTLGGPGDVISVTAVFPKRVLFGFLGRDLGLGLGMDLKATTVVRNEAVVRKAI